MFVLLEKNILSILNDILPIFQLYLFCKIYFVFIYVFVMGKKTAYLV